MKRRNFLKFMIGGTVMTTFPGLSIQAERNQFTSLATLYFGTTKVTCLIARQEGGHPPCVIGIGHHVSGGVRNGAIVDMELAMAAVRAAVAAAEDMAGFNVSGVTVVLSGAHFKSRLVAYDIGISGHEIGDQDLRKILDPSRLDGELPEDQEIVHTISVGYSVDDNRGVREPRGMFGDRLGVRRHVVTASANALRNIETCVHRCHLEVEGIVAPALSALVKDCPSSKYLGELSV